MVWISLGAMSISGHDLRAGTAENYRAFAAEAHGRSALYAELATAVADDPLVLTFLDKLPAAKRQPNPLFAAACYLLGEPADLAALRRLVDGRADELGRTMLARRTQFSREYSVTTGMLSVRIYRHGLVTDPVGGKLQGPGLLSPQPSLRLRLAAFPGSGRSRKNTSEAATSAAAAA